MIGGSSLRRKSGFDIGMTNTRIAGVTKIKRLCFAVCRFDDCRPGLLINILALTALAVDPVKLAIIAGNIIRSPVLSSSVLVSTACDLLFPHCRSRQSIFRPSSDLIAAAALSGSIFSMV